jgi:dipeptide/tripeptide permease
MISQRTRLRAILGSILLILLIPAIAMLFTNEVKWSLFDFLAAAVLLTGTGLLIELVLRRVKKASHRWAICAVIIVLLLLTWAELAVGIFGTPFAGQ